MRKLLLLVLAVILLVLPASASIVTEDLNALARFYSDDYSVFASIRTDEGFITSLDTLFDQMLPFLPENQRPPMGLRELLDETLTSANIAPFGESIRPWLGDTASIGVRLKSETLINGDEPDVLVAVAADGIAAETFLQTFLAESQAPRITEGNAVIYELDESWFAFTSEAIFISNTRDLLPLASVTNPLSGEPVFGDTLNLLPADSYNVTVYINTGLITEMSLEEMADSIPETLLPLVQINGAMVLGFTVLDDSNLVMDIGQRSNLDALSEFGLTPIIPGAIDTSFTNRMPAESIATMQFSDFGGQIEGAFANIRALGDFFKANGGIANVIDPDGQQFFATERDALNVLDPAMLIGVMNLGVAGGTGLSLERDILPTIDGDMGLFLRVIPSPDFMIPFLPDGGIVFQTSDSANAARIVERIGSAALAYDQPWATEAYGDGQALVIPATATLGTEYPSLDVLLGSSGDVIALGTRNAVQSALNTTGLADTPTYQAASQYFLADAQGVLYLNTAPMLDLIETLVTDQTLPSDRDTRDLYRALSSIQSASITITAQADGVSLVRAVLSLNSEPRELSAPDA